ncbi:MAG TPA: M24 family metallopeptidase [Urbifossiella sp.]|nr:M24 family metallopeptidase [Urbifossiella sp.]
MEPLESEQAEEIDLGQSLPPPEANGVHSAPPSAPPPVALAARRADIDVKQAQVSWLLEQLECEAALFLAPPHIAWFTAGMNVRGLIADSERPAIYTNGRQRWLICSNIDTQRLFDEELDQLGFQLKEWAWESGRAELLLNVTTGRKVCGDRPLPNMPQTSERLRPILRILSAFEQDEYRALGRVVAHAVEATARNLTKNSTEEEVAGQLGHRILHRGAEPLAISISADSRGAKFRRSGFTSAPIQQTCVLQATALRGGLFATASRTVAFGNPPEEFRKSHDLALRLAAIYRSLSRPEETMTTARRAGQTVLGPEFEFEHRFAQPGYGAGRFLAEELRRGGQDERFALGQALVWQPRVGPAAVVDSAIVTNDGGECVTPPTDWPFKRVLIRGKTQDIPDIFVAPE